MNNLQIGLVALGIAVVCAVLLLNWWQDFRARRKMRVHLPDPSQDPLLPGAHAHSLASLQGQRQAEGVSYGANERVEPSFESEKGAGDKEEPDPVIEAVIDLIFNEEVLGEDLIPFVQGIRHAGHKPMRVFAETVDDVHRSSLHPTETYRSLQVAVLLANRSGALNSREWAEAVSRVRVLADQFEGNVETPDEQQVLLKAQNLDQLCAELDLQVGLTLLANEDKWDTETVLRVTQHHGFSNIINGKLYWVDEQGISRFSLGRADGHSLDSAVNTMIAGLNLVFDVPRTTYSPQGFTVMSHIARALAEELHANVVDDNGRLLAQGVEQLIDTHLEERYAQLEHHGLVAGSARASKVFSYPN